jgi:hypothetical protein
MNGPIRGMENVVIGKRYKVINKEFGRLDHGRLKYIEYHIKIYDGKITPVLHFEHGHCWAEDCGVIPYRRVEYNHSNTLHECAL